MNDLADHRQARGDDRDPKGKRTVLVALALDAASPEAAGVLDVLGRDLRDVVQVAELGRR